VNDSGMADNDDIMVQDIEEDVGVSSRASCRNSDESSS
jgi:hypothetical protein